jgi:predicted peptidase
MNKFYRDILSQRKINLLILLSTFFASVSFSQVQTLKAVQANITNNIAGYYESLPVDYYSNPTKKYPLLIFFHGSGELGNGTTDISKLASTGLPKLIKDGGFPTSFNVGGENFSFIVISPQMKTAVINIAAIRLVYLGV